MQCPPCRRVLAENASVWHMRGSDGTPRSTQEPGNTPERDRAASAVCLRRSGGGASHPVGHQDRDRSDDGAANATPPEVDRNAQNASITCMQVVNKRCIVLIQCFCVNEWLFWAVLSRVRVSRAKAAFRHATGVKKPAPQAAGRVENGVPKARQKLKARDRACAAAGPCRQLRARSAGRRCGSRSVRSAPWGRSWRR